jgi:hypothetical protein
LNPASQGSGEQSDLVVNFLLLLWLHFHILFSVAYYCCTESTLWHIQKCLQYVLVRFTPSIILLYLLSSLLRIVSTGLVFLFSYMSTYFHHIHPPSPFPYILPLLWILMKRVSTRLSQLTPRWWVCWYKYLRPAVKEET